MGDILMLAHRLPWPPDRGDRIRSYHVLKALAALGTVHLAAFVDDGGRGEPALPEALRPLVGISTIERRGRSNRNAAMRALAMHRPVSLAAFDSQRMRASVAHLIDELPIDTIYVFSGQMAQFVPADRGDRRLVMDFVDVDSAKFAAYAEAETGARRWLHRREARLLGRFEKRVACHADLSLFVSEAEARLFRARSGVAAERVAVLENGVDLDHFRPGAKFERVETPGPLIVFTGQMDYRPNIEAAIAFARQSLPRIREAAPGAHFAIVGREPTSAVHALAGLPGVIVTGEVADVRPWLAAAAVVVAPLGVGRGIQNKVLEAMAMGRPVVASSEAFAGIDATPERELIVAADPVAPVIALLSDAARAQALGEAARRRVEARYGWAQRLAPLAAMIGRRPALTAVA